MTTQFERDQQAAVDAAQREQNLALFRSWLATTHPEIRASIAVTRFFDEYMDFTNPLTEAEFEFAFGNLGSKIYGREHVPTPEETKTALIDKICEMIASVDGTGRDGKFSTFQLKQERGKMVHWTIPQLTARLDEVIRKQTLNLKPVAELKADVAATRQAERDQNPYFPYQRLPFEGVPSGKVRAVTYDGNYLKRLPAPLLQNFASKFGFPQLNDRIAGRDAEFEQWYARNGRGE